MRLTGLFALALAANVAVASSGWLTKSAYNKWHETELERWLSDNDIPYPTPADRKDLEALIQKNWDTYAVSPYKNWDTNRLVAYLKSSGVETKDTAAANKESLISQVRSQWHETEEQTQQAWSNAKDWLLDTWTDSTLKSFADKHNIPVPQPRKRDTLLQQIRSNYQSIAKKTGEAASYPGDWLYETWSESDLKEWLDTHGFPAPQPTTRDKLVAAVRRNAHIAYLNAQAQSASASAKAQAAYGALTDKIIDAWGDSQLKEFCDKNGVSVPQGTKTNELRALVRRHRAEFLGDTLSDSASSAFGAATSKAGNHYTQATDDASLAAHEAFNKVVGTWSDSRLKAYLDARGVPIPQASNTDKLRALVRRNSHKVASGFNAWSWEDLSYQELKQYLAQSSDSAAKKVGESADSTREDLLKAVQKAYSSASAAGGNSYASATNYLAQATQAAKDDVFDTWSESELKSYLDNYGVPVLQGSTLNELKAEARRQSTYFKYGTSNPMDTAFAKLGGSVKDAYRWVLDQLSVGSEEAKKKTKDAKGEL